VGLVAKTVKTGGMSDKRSAARRGAGKRPLDAVNGRTEVHTQQSRLGNVSTPSKERTQERQGTLEKEQRRTGGRYQQTGERGEARLSWRYVTK